jgi:hypothetical protein
VTESNQTKAGASVPAIPTNPVTKPNGSITTTTTNSSNGSESATKTIIISPSNPQAVTVPLNPVDSINGLVGGAFGVAVNNGGFTGLIVLGLIIYLASKQSVAILNSRVGLEILRVWSRLGECQDKVSANHQLLQDQRLTLERLAESLSDVEDELAELRRDSNQRKG